MSNALILRYSQGDGKKRNLRLSCRKEVGDELLYSGKKNEEYRLKAVQPIVAGLTLGIAIAKATAMLNTRVKQFCAFPFAGKAVIVPSMMTLPTCVLYRDFWATLTLGRTQFVLS